MPTLLLRPDPVTLGIPDYPGEFDAGMHLTGGSSALADQSDASYVEWHDEEAAVSGTGVVRGPLPAHSLPAGAVVTQAVVYVDAEGIEDATTWESRMRVAVLTPRNTDPLQDLQAEVTTFDPARQVYEFGPVLHIPLGLLASDMTGGDIIVQITVAKPGLANNSDLRIFEAWLEVDYLVGRSLAPLRQRQQPWLAQRENPRRGPARARQARR